MQTIVQTLVEVLPLNRPFALFGHSMGALMAFELARELRRQRRPAPACLFLSAHHAPQIPARRNKSRHLLPEAELIAELRCLNGTPEGVLQDGSLMQMLMPMLRADFAVVETYTYMPEPPLNCPITVFGGEQDPETTQEELASWREQTSASFSLRMFPGGHFFLHQAQPQLLREMSETTCMTLRHAAAGPAIW